MRRLAATLAAVLLTLPGLYAVGPAAHATPQACPPAAADRPTQLAQAQAVFSGVVTSAKPGGGGRAVVHDVTVDRIYQGQVASTDVRVRTANDRCGLGALSVDERYLFLVTADGDAWMAAGNSGTDRASDGLVAEVTSLLGPGTAPGGAPAAPAEADFERVTSVHPTPFLRVAAPGIALVIVGCLGLALARRRTA